MGPLQRARQVPPRVGFRLNSRGVYQTPLTNNVRVLLASSGQRCDASNNNNDATGLLHRSPVRSGRTCVDEEARKGGWRGL